MEEIINQPLAFFEESKRTYRIKIIEKTYERDMLSQQSEKTQTTHDQWTEMANEIKMLEVVYTFFQDMYIKKHIIQFHNERVIQAAEFFRQDIKNQALNFEQWKQKSITNNEEYPEQKYDNLKYAEYKKYLERIEHASQP